MQIMKQVFQLIDESGLSDAQICAKSGISKVTLWQWRSKGTIPRLDLLEYVLTVLKHEIKLCPIEQPPSRFITVVNGTKSPAALGKNTPQD